jgi:hypothetical protein
MNRAEIVKQLESELAHLAKEQMCIDAGLPPLDEMRTNSFSVALDDIRKKVFTDMDSLATWYRESSEVAHMRSGDGIIDRLLLVWVLRKNFAFVTQWPEPERNKFSRSLMQGRLNALENGLAEPTERHLYFVAPLLLPELTWKVLASHGLEV